MNSIVLNEIALADITCNDLRDGVIFCKFTTSKTLFPCNMNTKIELNSVCGITFYKIQEDDNE
jgi:hypothetical protein